MTVRSGSRCTPANRRLGGFTVAEMLITVTAAATLIATFAGVLQYMEVASAATDDSDYKRRQASLVLREIESGIRFADRVTKSGAGLLVMESRYAVDGDDDVETVMYELVGTDLLRTVVDGATTGPDVILEDCTTFSTLAFHLEDSFDSSVYGVALVLPDAQEPVVDTLVDAEFDSVSELGTLDPDFLPAWQPASENLALQAITSLVPRIVTASPRLPTEGLEARAKFVATVPGEDYSALAIHNPTTNGKLTLSFESNGKVTMVHLDSGSAETKIEGPDWDAGKPYEVEIRVRNGLGYASVDAGDGPEIVGKIPMTDLETGSVILAGVSLLGIGTWDDLEVRYPLVEIELGVSVGGASETFHGGAVPR